MVKRGGSSIQLQCGGSDAFVDILNRELDPQLVDSFLPHPISAIHYIQTTFTDLCCS